MIAYPYAISTCGPRARIESLSALGHPSCRNVRSGCPDRDVAVEARTPRGSPWLHPVAVSSGYSMMTVSEIRSILALAGLVTCLTMVGVFIGLATVPAFSANVDVLQFNGSAQE